MKKQGIDRVLFPLATAILLGLFSGQAFAEGQGTAASEGRWQQDGNNWKYVDGNGQEKTGWVESKGQWYFVDPQSKNLKSGWMEKDGKWFFLDTKADSLGKMATGWQWVDGYCYYFAGDSGRMYHNEKTPDGFFVQEGGKCANEKGEPLFDLSKGVQSTKEKEAVAEQARKEGKSLEDIVSLVAQVKSEPTGASQSQAAEANAGAVKFSGVVKSAGGSGGGGGGSSSGGGGGSFSGGGSGGGSSSGGGSFSGSSSSAWQTGYNPSTKNPFATKEELYSFHAQNELLRKQGIENRDRERARQEQERLDRQIAEQKEAARKAREAQERRDRENAELLRQQQAKREAAFRETEEKFKNGLEEPDRLQVIYKKGESRFALFAKGVDLNAGSFRKDENLVIAKNTYAFEIIPQTASSGFYDTANMAERVYGAGEENYISRLSYYAAERDALRHALLQRSSDVVTLKGTSPQSGSFKAKIFGKLHSLDELYTDALAPTRSSAYALYPKTQEAGQSQRASASTLSRSEATASASNLGREEAQNSTLPQNLKNEALFDEQKVNPSDFSEKVLEHLKKGEVLLLEHSGFNRSGNQIAVVYGAEWDIYGELTALYLTEPDDSLQAMKRYPVKKLSGSNEEKLVFTPEKNDKVQSKLKYFYTVELYEKEPENLFFDVTG
ncbi:IdeS/Mac family cysteine endopeptidase [Oribacterium sinus]